MPQAGARSTLKRGGGPGPVVEGARSADRGGGLRRQEHLQPRATAGCGARGTSLTCEASAGRHRHAAPHRAERGPVACSASLCGPDHATPTATRKPPPKRLTPEPPNAQPHSAKLRHRRGGATKAGNRGASRGEYQKPTTSAALANTRPGQGSRSSPQPSGLTI